jgi:predicted N-acyltransferase
MEEIDALMESMIYHYPKSLEETETDLHRVRHVFGMVPLDLKPKVNSTALHIQLEKSITEIDKELWNGFFHGMGTYDWDGLLFLEQGFQGNDLVEHNWEFRYLIIRDPEGKPILATFMTIGLWKDDMLVKESISKHMEIIRQHNPYHLTTRVLSIGSLFTEGNHLYLDEDHPLKDQALDMLIKTMETVEHNMGSKMTVLRDFGVDNSSGTFLNGQGFLRVQMPDSCSVELIEGEGIEAYISKLSVRNRRHFRKEIKAFEPEFQVDIPQDCNKELLEQLFALYNNVHQNNIGLNTFPFPEKVFSAMAEHPNWEFILLSLVNSPQQPIGVMFCYKNQGLTYVPAFVGLDYAYVPSHHTYRQLLYQTIKRAVALGFHRIDFGMTAAFEKRKLGATVSERFAYVQAYDNFTMELLGIMERDG